MDRPERTEYAPFYHGYVELVPEADILAVLTAQPGEIRKLLANTSEAQAEHAYEEGKWTIKELVGHINHGERVFGYRAFRFAHGDPTPLASFDQDIYVRNGRSNRMHLSALLDEFDLLRRGNLIVLDRLEGADWTLEGTASDASVTVRALAFIMAGHVRHHMNVLGERYLR